MTMPGVQSSSGMFTRTQDPMGNRRRAVREPWRFPAALQAFLWSGKWETWHSREQYLRARRDGERSTFIAAISARPPVLCELAARAGLQPARLSAALTDEFQVFRAHVSDAVGGPAVGKAGAGEIQRFHRHDPPLERCQLLRRSVQQDGDQHLDVNRVDVCRVVRHDVGRWFADDGRDPSCQRLVIVAAPEVREAHSRAHEVCSVVQQRVARPRRLGDLEGSPVRLVLPFVLRAVEQPGRVVRESCPREALDCIV
mmetsp:Transcript_32012/g.98802  ORF Transcript_32012/g.98802 Transcript_32012/m.98802 type:complete len:255 (+) Transcript_32012:1033-1797(+)